MFSKNYLVMIFFVGSLLSSDNTPKKGRFDSHAVIKKFVVPGAVGIAISVLSQKTYCIDTNDKGLLFISSWIDSIFTNQGTPNRVFKAIFANVKLVVDSESRLLLDTQKIFTFISGLHGLAAAAACRYGLNRFFPG